MLGIHAHVHCARGKQAREQITGRAAEQVAWDYNVLECPRRALRIEHRNSSYTLVEPALHSLYLKEKQFIVNELLVDS